MGINPIELLRRRLKIVFRGKDSLHAYDMPPHAIMIEARTRLETKSVVLIIWHLWVQDDPLRNHYTHNSASYSVQRTLNRDTASKRRIYRYSDFDDYKVADTE